MKNFFCSFWPLLAQKPKRYAKNHENTRHRFFTKLEVLILGTFHPNTLKYLKKKKKKLAPSLFYVGQHTPTSSKNTGEKLWTNGQTGGSYFIGTSLRWYKMSTISVICKSKPTISTIKSEVYASVNFLVMVSFMSSSSVNIFKHLSCSWYFWYF